MISVCALAALLTAIHFELFEAFVEFSEGHESWQLDEFIFVPVVFGVAFGVYAARRWREMRREVVRREREERLRRFNEQSARILESIADAFFALDEDWRFTYVNSQAERLLAREKGSLLGRYIWEEFPEAVGTTFYEEYHRAVAERTTVTFEEFYEPLESWFEVHAYPASEGLSVYFRNVNDRKEAERALVESEERLRSVMVQYASDVITILDREGRVTYESPAIKYTLGYGPEEMVGAPALDLVHPDDAERAGRELGRIFERGGVSPPVEFRVRHADGSWRHFEGIASRIDGGANARVVVNSRDVTERKRLEAELQRQALHDPLTDLPNRRLFSELLEQALEGCDARGRSVAVLFLDLDDFKGVNDSLGHEAGDRLLIRAAERIKGCLRSEDVLARFGGDEFTVLLRDVSEADDVVRVVERISAVLRQPVEISGREIPVSTSIGIAFGEACDEPDLLLRAADFAMYRAKERGKARYEMARGA